jgi:TRAP transporter TAXI family solute receptor
MKRSRIRVVQASAALLLLVAVALAVALVRSRLHSELVMATGPPGSAYADYGEQYRKLLARSGVAVSLRESGGTLENLALLSDPASGVDVAFLSAGTTTADESPDLQTLGTVFLEELWFFSRNASLRDGDLAALNGKRVSVGSRGSATRVVAEVLIQLNRIAPDSVDFLELPSQDAADQLRRGQIDAALIMSTADSQVVRGLLQDPSIDLVSIRRAAAYVARYPFLVQLTVPEGVGNLALNRPSRDIETFGVPVSLGVRSDMQPALQALLLDVASQIHGGAGMFNAAGRFPAEQGFDLPLSHGAIQYYKSGLPLLQRYLPFELAILATQLLFVVIPLVGVLYPLLRFAPALYGWAMRRHVLRLYGELKLLEHDLGDGTGADRRPELRRRLEELERRVERMRVPVTYAPLVYNLRLHIDLVRARL